MTLRFLYTLMKIMPKSKEKVFYAIGVGRETGIFNTWSECKTLIDGVANAKFKKFDKYSEAEAFVNMWSHKKPIISKRETKEGSPCSFSNPKEGKSAIKGECDDDAGIIERKEKDNCVKSDSDHGGDKLQRRHSFPVVGGLTQENRLDVKKKKKDKKSMSQGLENAVEVKTEFDYIKGIGAINVKHEEDKEGDVISVELSDNESVNDKEELVKSVWPNVKKRLVECVDEIAKKPAAMGAISATDALQKLVSVTTDVLKQITAGIVAAVAAEGLSWDSLDKVKRSVLGVDETACAPSGKRTEDDDGQQRLQADLGERISECEKKIDSALEVLKQVLPVLTELKQARRELSEMYQVVCGGGSMTTRIGASPLKLCNARNLSTSPCSQSPVKSGSKKGCVSPSIPSDSDSDDLKTVPTKRKRTFDEFASQQKVSEESNFTIPGENSDILFTTDKDGYVEVYTDGACSANGRTGAKAGIGIWFGDGHPWNISRPYQGDTPTNNNAEIQAARIAVELAVAAGISKLKIITDSEFLINCATEWVPMWKKRNWMTIQKQPVKNKVELVKLDNLLSSLSVRWEKVEGHAGVKGNEMADSLAVKGAAQYS